MTLLERWNPRKEVDRLRNELDDLFQNFAIDRMWPKEMMPTTTRPALESCVEGDTFKVRVDLPGIDPKTIDVKVADGVLTVRGSREEKTETKKADYFRREIRYGAFERSIAMPEGIKADTLKANYRNGVLELTAPITREIAPAPVKIAVDTAEGARA